MEITKHKKSIKVPKREGLTRVPSKGFGTWLGFTFVRREIDLQREIIRWAKARGYACGKTKVQGMKQSDGRYYKDRLSFRGFPDLVMFTPGLVFVEVKGPKGRLRPDQREFQEFCRKAEVKYIVAKSVGDVIKEVEE